MYSRDRWQISVSTCPSTCALMPCDCRRAVARLLGTLTLLFLSVVLVADASQAQGFQILNGRNHPELTWRVAETEHFRIIYPTRLEGIESEAAPIAERSYSVLANNLETEFDRKIDIYLSDEDEIANGFAVPFGNGYTNIWVHAGDYANLKTGREKWLRSVIAHELAHIFHYRAVLGRPRWLNFLLANPLPRSWTEGIAQYETEDWTALRGDLWLRTAVLDDNLSYSDGQSLWNGRLLYAIGNSQVRYLTDQYGDSTLVNILKHRKNVLFGLAEVHDFDTAFRNVTGTAYRDFYDEWRRHVNVYYNTMAGQMEVIDSLDTAPMSLPGQYYFDVAYSPDTSHVAILSVTSLRRPVQRLSILDPSTNDVTVVAEGAIQTPVAWSPDGRRLAYSRRHRGRHGSILRDIYIVDRDGSNRRRLTNNRRAGSPTFSPDGSLLAYAASEGGADDIYTLNLNSGKEIRLTDYSGDVQISTLRWHPDGDEIAFDRFLADGRRDVAAFDLNQGTTRAITDGEHDDRDPVWSPDGRRIAYTSLRDGVPNVFIADGRTGPHRRVTALVTGSEVRDWLPPDSAGSDHLVITSQVSKTGENAFRIDASRAANEPQISIPTPYGTWTAHRPPQVVPVSVPLDTGLILDRYAYTSIRNITHVATAVLPYAWLDGDFGIAGFTSWIDPLGKHTFLVAGAFSAQDPGGNSIAAASYLNNQWYPTIGLNVYRLPGSARIYGNDLLVETYAGGDITMVWPLDWWDSPYLSEQFAASLRFVDTDPITDDHLDTPDALPLPIAGQQADLRVGMSWKKQRPYRDNVVHPLDGLGLRVQVTAAARVIGTDSEFVRGDISAFGIFAGLGLQRLFVYGRFQAQEGEPFPQDFVGLSRHDDFQIDLPVSLPIAFGDSERVRGYRSYALGDRLLFGTLEYRIPLLSSLQTRLLGAVSLGSVAAAAFADGGLVWSGANLGDGVSRLGLGVEVKNALQIGGLIRLTHAVGLGQKAVDFGADGDYEIYYRIRTSVPF